MLSAISQGHADLADVLFLIAFILFAIVVVSYLIENVHTRVTSAIMATGLALVALAWFVL